MIVIAEIITRHSAIRGSEMRFIHTADWQIGKPFKQFGDKESVLRQARLNVIETIGRLAVSEGAAEVLVAGDVYDCEAPNPRTLREPLERMRRFCGVNWRLLPGNHDPHQPKGVWDRVRDSGLPDNVFLCLSPEPLFLGADAALLPAPLTRKSEMSDLTEWMNAAETPPGVIRIGLAHGAIRGFDQSGEANNPVDPRRTTLARLDYLALGDWHRTMSVGPTMWYAGTPEPDRAGGGQEEGHVLLVDIPGQGAEPRVEKRKVGAFRWLTLEEDLSDVTDLADLEFRLRNLSDLSALILRLRFSGVLPLFVRAELDRRLESLGAAMFHLAVDLGGLSVRPTATDFEAIDFGGVLRRAAERLKAMTDDAALTSAERRRAEDALVRLYLMQVGA
jgi:DNA repair exonuclease SbcCD nuclease subunit